MDLLLRGQFDQRQQLKAAQPSCRLLQVTAASGGAATSALHGVATRTHRPPTFV